MLSGGPLMLGVLIILGIVIAIYVVRKKATVNKETTSEYKNIRSATVNNTGMPTINSEPKSEEEVAALLALHIYLTQNNHDLESNVLTIERIQRRYSPWSSKIYSMNNFQR